MDHLFLPHGACLQVEDIVLYKGSTEYLNHNFLDFAAAKGYSFLLDPLASANHTKNYEALTAPDRLNPFLQEWLFCGFLREVFGVIPRQLLGDGMFEHAQFIRHARIFHSNPTSLSTMTQKVQSAEEEIDNKVQEVEARRPVLCTESLVALANAWVQSIKIKIQKSAPHQKHLNECISIISRTLKHLLMRQPSIQYDSKTIAVIATTTDFVVTMISKTFENTEANKHILIDNGSWVPFGWRDAYVERMVSLGWCRHEAASVNSKFPALQVIHFCANMRRQEALDHNQSTTEACRASVDSSIPKHISTCKDAAVICDAYAVEGDLMEEMLRIIRDNGLPLLKMRKYGDKLEISMERRNGHDKYIALSHVWSDGMGNHISNSLPRCQLESLHAKLSKIPRERPRAAGDELLVWIDTLCCPVEAASQEGEKAKVLGQMRQIYEEADFVFVLDSELESIDSRPLSILETAFRTLNSNWMRRLWTLQEGYLAAKIWVQFKDEAFELDQDAIKKMDLHTLSIEHFWIGRTVKTLYTSLRRRLVQESIDRQIESTFLTMALQGRSVTEPSDEPLCIATLFNLDAGQVAAVGTKEHDSVTKRMSILWTLMHRSTIGIPKSVLFYTGRKLSLDGFHWAPASFLGQTALPLAAALFTDPVAPSAAIDYSGLCVQSEGILFSPVCSVLRCLQRHRNLRSVNIIHDPVIYLRDDAGRWFIFGRQSDLRLAKTTEPSQKQTYTNDHTETKGCGRAADREFVRYGVIFRDNIVNRHPTNPPSGVGLLVAVHGSEGQSQLVTAIETVITNRAMPEQAAAWEIAYQMTVEVRKSDIFKTVQRRDTLRNATADLNPLRFHVTEIPNANSQSIRSVSGQSVSDGQNKPPISEEESTDAELVEEYALRLIRRQIVNDPSIISTLQRIGLNAGFLEGMVALMLAGTFGMEVEFRSSDHVWCVD